MNIKYNQRIDSLLKLRAIYGPEVAFAGLTELEARLLENHYQDPSTGTYRERASIILSNSEAWPGQHDYDAVRDGKPIECKPKTHNGASKNARGYGSINDHTPKRHEKFLREGMIMQQSQFFYGYCAWVVEFPYEWIADHMISQIPKKKDGSGRICGKFDYKHWIDCPDIEIKWLNKGLIKQYRKSIVGGSFKTPKLLYKWLIEQDVDFSFDHIM